jgi:hypothetical protein
MWDVDLCCSRPVHGWQEGQARLCSNTQALQFGIFKSPGPRGGKASLNSPPGVWPALCAVGMGTMGWIVPTLNTSAALNPMQLGFQQHMLQLLHCKAGSSCCTCCTHAAAAARQGWEPATGLRSAAACGGLYLWVGRRCTHPDGPGGPLGAAAAGRPGLGIGGVGESTWRVDLGSSGPDYAGPGPARNGRTSGSAASRDRTGRAARRGAPSP